MYFLIMLCSMDTTNDNHVVCSCGIPAILLTVKNPSSSNLGKVEVLCSIFRYGQLNFYQDVNFTSALKGKVDVTSSCGLIHHPMVVLQVVQQCHLHHPIMAETVHKIIAG